MRHMVLTVCDLSKFESWYSDYTGIEKQMKLLWFIQMQIAILLDNKISYQKQWTKAFVIKPSGKMSKAKSGMCVKVLDLSFNIFIYFTTVQYTLINEDSFQEQVLILWKCTEIAVLGFESEGF